MMVTITNLPASLKFFGKPLVGRSKSDRHSGHFTLKFPFSASMRGSRHASQMLCPHGRTRGDFTVLRQTVQKLLVRKRGHLNSDFAIDSVENKQGASLEFLLTGINYALSAILSYRRAPNADLFYVPSNPYYIARCIVDG